MSLFTLCRQDGLWPLQDLLQYILEKDGWEPESSKCRCLEVSNHPLNMLVIHGD